jgi:phenol 2-monooxygenase (NADPH)
MNVSMQDGFNLGWKLAAVLQKRCPPQILHSYSQERHAVAKELIDFDREWADVLASASKASAQSGTNDAVAVDVQDYFVRHGRYTAGTAVRYRRSIFTGGSDHQRLALGFPVGMRFHSAPVIRLTDAKPVQLGHTIKADGRWRLFAFADAGDPAAHDSAIWRLCHYLANAPGSPIIKYTPVGQDVDSVIDVRAVFQQKHSVLSIENLPPLLLPAKGRFALLDYEKMFCPDLKNDHDIFAMRGIDRGDGCVVIVRPDQYVAHVLPLDGFEEIALFSDSFMQSHR